MILYEQVTPIVGQDLHVRDANLFVARMNAAFGAFPVELNKAHIERLEGMKAATLGEQSQNPYDQLIYAVKRYGTIRVWEKIDPFEDKS